MMKCRHVWAAFSDLSHQCMWWCLTAAIQECLVWCQCTLIVGWIGFIPQFVPISGEIFDLHYLLIDLIINWLFRYHSLIGLFLHRLPWFIIGCSFKFQSYHLYYLHIKVLIMGDKCVGPGCWTRFRDLPKFHRWAAKKVSLAQYQ